jgi:hypothetical protein
MMLDRRAVAPDMSSIEIGNLLPLPRALRPPTNIRWFRSMHARGRARERSRDVFAHVLKALGNELETSGI